MAATATASEAKASTYEIKMELRDGKRVFTIPKRHRDAFLAARDRAQQYAKLEMPGLSEEAKAAVVAIDALLAKV